MTRDIVAVGASAGGIHALQTLVSGLPTDFGGAVLIVQHLAANSPRMLPQILSRAGTLPVHFAVDGATPEVGRIYVAPPDYHLLLDSSGNMRLSRGPKENNSRPAIDPLFRSAALAFGPRLIGVVMTGYLDDGASGLKAIDMCGGTCVVQDPFDAEVPSMPQNALRSVTTAKRVRLRRLAHLLNSLVGSPAEKASPMTDRDRKEMEIEAAIAAGDLDSLAGVRNLGTPSLLTCPECHGVLSELRQSPPHRFRCHTGHAYTADTLLAAVRECADAALWRAARALQEQAILLRHVAEHADEARENHTAEALQAEAKRAVEAAEAIRAIERPAQAGASNT